MTCLILRSGLVGLEVKVHGNLGGHTYFTYLINTYIGLEVEVHGNLGGHTYFTYLIYTYIGLEVKVHRNLGGHTYLLDKLVGLEIKVHGNLGGHTYFTYLINTYIFNISMEHVKWYHGQLELIYFIHIVRNYGESYFTSFCLLGVVVYFVTKSKVYVLAFSKIKSFKC